MNESLPIPQCPQYSATADGQIIRTDTGSTLSQRVLHNGYMTTTLKISGRSQPKLVHILVLSAFKGGPPHDDAVFTCDHVDRNRSNNRIENLRWATPSQQAANSSNMDIGKARPAQYRPILTTSCETGEATIYPRLAEAMTAIAPQVHHKNGRVYKALKTGISAFQHRWEYVPPPAGTFKEIPTDLIDKSKGYKVSDTGFVMTPTGRVHKGVLGTSCEYYTVNINRIEYRVHRLVAATFLPTKEGKTVVNHINGLKTDNRVVNLEWSDARGIAQHAVDTGASPLPAGVAIEKRSIDGSYIQSFPSIRAAARAIGDENRYNNILACCKGRQKTAYGFLWYYEVESN